MRLWGFCLVFSISFSYKKGNTIRAALLCGEPSPELTGRVMCRLLSICSSICVCILCQLPEKYSSVCFYYPQWHTLLNASPEGPKSRRKNQFFKMSGFDLADLFANWHFGAIIRRKLRQGGTGDSPETWRPGDLVKPAWLLEDATYLIMWADTVKAIYALLKLPPWNRRGENVSSVLSEITDWLQTAAETLINLFANKLWICTH